MDPRKHTPRHIIIKSPKTKDNKRILKAAREKDTVTYKGVPIRLSADFSKETLKERDLQEVQEAQRVPKKLDARKHMLRYLILTLPEIKSKES